MKKMPYTIIFLIVMVVLVFAGCMKFKSELPGMTNDASDEEPIATQESPAFEQNTLTEEEQEQAILEVIEEMRSAVDENGVTRFSDEALSSAAEELRSEAQSEREAVASQAAAASSTQSQQPVSAPTTTQKSDSEQPQSTQPAQTTAPQPSQNATTQTTPAAPTGVNEYDVLRSGKFYCVGTMVDAEGTNPLEIAITDSSVYMLTKFESVDMAMLVSGGKTYMIYPEKKAYLKLSKLIMGMMGLDTDELISSSDMGFSDMEPLDQANAVVDGNLKGQACKIYNFSKTDGSKTLIYMDGNHLLGFETYNAAGTMTAGTYLTSITANVPADKTVPPADYQEASLTSFMKMLSEVIA